MQATLLLGIILSTGLFFYIIFMKHLKNRKLFKGFSGPKILPVVGNAWQLVNSRDIIKTFTPYLAKYGNRLITTAGPVKIVTLIHPNDVEKILSSKEHVNKPAFYNMVFADWLGSSMFYAKGKEYFTMRKMILPSFSSKICQRAASSVNKHTKTLLSILKGNEANGIPSEMYSLLTLCTLDITFEVFVGKIIDCLNNPKHEYAVAMHNETKYLSQRLITPWLWPELLWKVSPVGRKERANRNILQTYMEKVVHDLKVEVTGMKSGLVGDDQLEIKDQLNLIDLLIHEQQRGLFQITDKYIRDELNGGIFAGHETVASNLTWTVYLLATHPEEQMKLHVELDEVFGSDKSKTLEFSDLKQLKFLDCCINESLRMFPPAPAYFRTIEKDEILDKDTTIPGGVIAMIVPWLTHRLPQFYPEPEKFMPSRFFLENSVHKHRFAFIPFSAGPRNCIGQKLTPVMTKIVLAHIFRNFIVELASPQETISPVTNMVIFPKNGLHIRLKCRET